MSGEPQHTICLPCVIDQLTGGPHFDCVGRDGSRWCQCLCPWMETDDEIPRR